MRNILLLAAMTLLFFGLLSIPDLVLAQTWQLQTSGVTVPLRDVDFVDSLRGWVVGGSGTILMTTDGGEHWQQQTSGTTELLRNVEFVDSLYGWTSGQLAGAFRTTDGGANWLPMTVDTWTWYDLQFVNRSVGHMVSGVELPDNVYGTIARTTDGGATWDSTVGINDGGFQGVHFITELEGWSVGGKHLLDNFDPDLIVYTTDGGETWTEQTTPSYGPLYRVTFVDNKKGYAGGFTDGGGYILKTTDGGENWNPIYAPGGPQGVLSLAVPDSETIWVVRYESVHRSTNSGLSWEELGPPGGLTISSCFLSPTQGWLVGFNGSIWRLNQLNSNRFETSTVSQFLLGQNYPNPFNSSTTIAYWLRESGEVTMSLIDLAGREISVIDEGRQGPGYHLINLKMEGIASGIYFYTLRQNGIRLSRKLVYLK